MKFSPEFVLTTPTLHFALCPVSCPYACVCLAQEDLVSVSVSSATQLTEEAAPVV